MTNIAYSDGDVEKYIEKLIEKEPNVSSKINIAKDEYSNWPVRYHLSSIRSNAIKHLCFDGLDVLELGAGMGAMSRYVAEHCKHLTVVEGTEQRMACLKKRLRDLKNWDGAVCNYQDFKTAQKYDVVCFFGVLEYAGRYIKEKNPFIWAIKFAKSFLKDGGVLLVSIENKNGIKYFQGISEDHYATPYYGICGYSEINDVKTFSKKEMLDMLQNCGFSCNDVHHLAPDYKCTRALLSDEFINKYPMIAANIESNYIFEDYGQKTKPLYPSKLVMSSLAKSGILGEFSNSYLFIACSDEKSVIRRKVLENICKKQIDVFLYTYGRKNEVRTIFQKKGDEYIVSKEMLEHSIQENNKLIKYDFKDERMLEGIELSYLFLNYAYYGNNQELMDLMYKYFEFIFAEYKTSDEQKLKADAFDAIIQNVLLKDGNFVVFDKEYKISFELRKSYFVFRTITSFAKNMQYLKNFKYNTLNDLYEDICKKYKIKSDLKNDIKQEIAIQNEICCDQIDSCGYEYLMYTPINLSENGKQANRRSLKILGLPIYEKIKNNTKRKIKILGISISYKKKEKNVA